MIKTIKALGTYGINLFNKEVYFAEIDVENKINEYKKAAAKIEELNLQTIENRLELNTAIDKIKKQAENSEEQDEKEFFANEIKELEEIKVELESSLDENIAVSLKIEKTIRKAELLKSTYLIKHKIYKHNFQDKDFDLKEIFVNLDKDIEKLKNRHLAKKELKLRYNHG